tara:strand:+ start:3690 stop:4478 length:789 start_codon:yes stop_codon:yes gene_type:complete
MTDTTQQPERSLLPATIGRVAASESKGYIVPTNAEEAYELARLLETSAGSSFKDLNQIATAILAGQEAGLGPVYSVQNIAIINGRPSMWGNAILALIQSSGKLEDYKVQRIGPSFDIDSAEIKDWPADFGVTVTMKRRGQETPYVGKFTVGDAKRAGLWMNTRKSPWINHPLDMLERRALGKAANKGFADVLAGLGVREEQEDYHSPKNEVDHSNLLSDEPDILSDEPVEEIEDAEIEEVQDPDRLREDRDEMRELFEGDDQ